MTLEPSRISMARMRAGFNKTELARRLEVTTRTITTYESVGAPDVAAPDLALALGCHSNYFHRPPVEELEEDRVFFRARRRSTALQKNAATSAGRTGVELYSLLAERFSLPELAIPDLAHLDARSAAQQLRAEWNMGADPMPNSVRLAESKGIRVLTLPRGTADVDAFSLWELSRPYIFLSMEKSAERSRFDMAHEIGHLVLHGGAATTPAGDRDAEKEADRFASELLMPRSMLHAHVRREPSVQAIMKLKQFLGVSAMAATYALHKADLLSDWSYRQAMVELTRRGFRTAEPGGMARETSRVFEVTFPALRKNDGLTVEIIARELGVSASEVHDLTFGQALVGVHAPAEFEGRQEQGRPHLKLVSGGRSG